MLSENGFIKSYKSSTHITQNVIIFLLFVLCQSQEFSLCTPLLTVVHTTFIVRTKQLSKLIAVLHYRSGLNAVRVQKELPPAKCAHFLLSVKFFLLCERIPLQHKVLFVRKAH